MKIEEYYHDDPEAQRRAEIVSSLIPSDLRDPKIIDLACGNGELLGPIPYHNKVGFDISPQCIENCKKKGINGYVLDFEMFNLPYEDNTFDLVIATEIFEHMFNPIKLLKEIERIAKKDAIIILSFPNETNLICRLRFLFTGRIHNPFSVGSHIRFFTIDSLKEELSKRFKIEKIVGEYTGTKIYSKFPFFKLLRRVSPELFSRLIVMGLSKK